MKKILIKGWLIFCAALGITIGVLSLQSFSENSKENKENTILDKGTIEHIGNFEVTNSAYTIRKDGKQYIIVTNSRGGIDIILHANH